MGPDEFKREFLCEPSLDEEYLYYFDLWIKYRKLIHYLSVSQNREAYRIHKEIFEGLPKNDKYYEAKGNSLRFYEKEYR